jgi:predicted permease
MLSKLKTALLAMLRRSQAECELDDELRYHIEQQTEQNIRLGMSPEEARQAALKSFGGLEQAKERSRDVRGVRWIEDLWQDLCFGARMLAKHTGFTLVALLILALGIGANTAIFSVVHGVLLKPLPYPDPDRIVTVALTFPLREIELLRADDYLDWREQSQSFTRLAGYDMGDASLTGSGEAERLMLGRVSSNFFPLLGVKPLLGRDFRPEEDRPGGQSVALLSQRLWQRRFGSDPDIVGKTLTLDGAGFLVVGVVESGIRFPGGAGFFEMAHQSDIDLWVPLALNVRVDKRREFAPIGVIGRLKPEITLAQAQADLEAITRRIQQAYPNEYKGAVVKVSQLSEQMVGKARSALLILSGAVVFVLLIACVNVANLLLVRAMARRKELAVRAALGAGRVRLIRQLLTETAILSLLGGAIGLLLAWGGVRWLVALEPDWVPRVRELGINGTVLGFTCLISILAGLIAGLLPALLASRTDLNDALKEGLGAKFSTRRGWWRASPALVVVELALSLVLLIGAGLMVKSFLRLLGVEKGFQTENVLTMKVRLSRSKDPAQPSQHYTYCRELLARLQTLPGVQSAALTTWLPLTGLTGRGVLNIEGRPPWENGKVPIVEVSTVSPDYFRTLGAQMRAGRAFNEDDRADAPPVVIINETLARRFFPGEDPLRKRLGGLHPLNPKSWAAIVGVVADIKHLGLDEEVRPEIYTPYTKGSVPSDPILVVRTAVDPVRLAAAVRREIAAGSPDQPVYEMMTMEQRLANSTAVRRNGMLLFALFAAVALIIAAIGIYGVISYSVGKRTREIGIRMALGAERRDVLKLVLKQGLKLIFAGVTIGLIASLALTRLMKNLLFEVSATDPPTFVVIALILNIVALSACWVPARRATKVDPLVALRND